MKCPNCASVKFYVEIEGGKLFFFHVGSDRRVISTDSSKDHPAVSSDETIFCISCSWYGRLPDLVS